MSIHPICDDCNETSDFDSILDLPQGYLCYDCARLRGICLDCGGNLRELVEDYFDYEEDRCPACLKEANKLLVTPHE